MHSQSALQRDMCIVKVKAWPDAVCGPLHRPTTSWTARSSSCLLSGRSPSTKRHSRRQPVSASK